MKPDVQCKTKDGCRGDTAPVGDAANGTERDFVRMLDHVTSNGRQARGAPASATGQTVAQLGQISRWPVGARAAFNIARGRLSLHSRSQHVSTPSCAGVSKARGFLRSIRQTWLPSLAAEDGSRRGAGTLHPPIAPLENVTPIGIFIPLLTAFGTFVTR